jgi:formylmethanofuran dehydrogenase subunit E
MGMHTNGPEHHDCAKCGGRITNQPRVTMADGRIVCTRCYVGDQREGVSLNPTDK